MSSEIRVELARLLKFPVGAISIVIMIWLLKVATGLDAAAVLTNLSSRLTKAGDFEFSDKERLTLDGLVGDLKGEDNRLATRLAAIENALASPKPQQPAAIAASIEAASFDAEASAQEVRSVETHLLSAAASGGGTLLRNRDGFLWVGNTDNKGLKFTRSTISSEGRAVESVDTISVGSEYRVTGNIVLRQSMPQDTAEYYRAVPAIGVVPIGTSIRVKDLPRRIERYGRDQLWANVTVLE